MSKTDLARQSFQGHPRCYEEPAPPGSKFFSPSRFTRGQQIFLIQEQGLDIKEYDPRAAALQPFHSWPGNGAEEIDERVCFRGHRGF
ncbi:MAG: hypothetical protein HGA74_16610 [Deltaproteobacteria bacterium]|nr:hypothetical protein [Deltaproteobacteria bacterium]